MKVKILKHISGSTFRSWNEGDIVYVEYGIPVLISDGIKISVTELIEQGFIEEVKETPKLRWKVGDKVVRLYETYSPDYLYINRVTLHSSRVLDL